MDVFKGKQKATQIVETPVGRIFIEAAAPEEAPDNMLDGYLTEHEFAEQIGRKLRTIRRWRALKEGPPWHRIGRQTYYKKTTLRAWFDGLEQEA
jgi:hypothetical protein